MCTSFIAACLQADQLVLNDGSALSVDQWLTDHCQAGTFLGCLNGFRVCITGVEPGLDWRDLFPCTDDLVFSVAHGLAARTGVDPLDSPITPRLAWQTIVTAGGEPWRVHGRACPWPSNV